MAQQDQPTSSSMGQPPFFETIDQLTAHYRLGSLQAQYSDRQAGMGLLLVGLVFLALLPLYALVEVPQSVHSPPPTLLDALVVLVIFLLATLGFSALGIAALFVNDYVCSDGFLKVRGRRRKRVLQAVRWDQIQEVRLGRSQGRSFPYLRDTLGTRYIVRREVWLRAGSELAHREFAARSAVLLASFHTNQPVAFDQLRVSLSGIALPGGKNTSPRVLPFQTITQVSYDLYRNRRGNSRTLLSFTLHPPAKLPPIDMVSAGDAALFLLLVQMVSQGQIRCKYAGRAL